MAGELAAEWIKIPDGNGNLKKVWVRDSTARRDIAQLQTDLAELETDVGGLVIPDPSDTAPQMDGTAAAGSSADYARADHVHPTDTSRQEALTTAQLAAVNSGITAAKVADYDAIQVPTKTSELTNDSGFITSAALPTKTSDLTNDSGFITAAAVPDPSSESPRMDGTAAAGSSSDYARADHVHPHDSTKQDVGKFAVITGTTPSANGWGSYMSYPVGFSESNCVMLNYEMYRSQSSDWRFGEGSFNTGTRVFCSMDATGVRIYSNNSETFNRPVRVTLMRTDI